MTLPQTLAATQARLATTKKPKPPTKRGACSNAIVSLNLKTVEEVNSYARAEAAAGRTDILDFVLGCKDLRGFVRHVWDIENAPEKAPPGRVLDGPARRDRQPRCSASP